MTHKFEFPEEHVHLLGGMHEDVFALLYGSQKLSVVLHQPGLLGNVLYAQVEKLALALAGKKTDPA